MKGFPPSRPRIIVAHKGHDQLLKRRSDEVWTMFESRLTALIERQIQTGNPPQVGDDIMPFDTHVFTITERCFAPSFILYYIDDSLGDRSRINAMKRCEGAGFEIPDIENMFIPFADDECKDLGIKTLEEAMKESEEKHNEEVKGADNMTSAHELNSG